MFDVAEAWAHIDSLAADYGVTVKLVEHNLDSEAYIAARTVYVPEELDEVRYLIALHELGHVASDLARRLHYEHVRACTKGGGFNSLDTAVACEAAAWGWAWEHIDTDVLPVVSKKLRRKVGRMLTSHLANF